MEEDQMTESILKLILEMIYLLTGERGNLGDYNIVVKEEYKEEDEEYGVMEKLSEGPKALFKDIMVESPTNINPPEGCPRNAMEKPSKHHLTLSPGCKMEDEDITGEKTMISSMDGGDHSVERPCDPSDSEEPRTVRDGGDHSVDRSWNPSEQPHAVRVGAVTWEEKTFSCPECGETFSSKLSLSVHQRSHTGKKLHFCSECGKGFLHKSQLVRHHRSHTGEKPYSCPECAKCFSNKAHLSRHQRFHAGEKPYPCSECGKHFSQKSDLVKHQRSHTGEQPYACSECGKCFSTKAYVYIHHRSHTGEKPYTCPECGKCFTQMSGLNKHQRSHTTLEVIVS
ncbi:uncharacterized protein ACMZJ9_015229 [Mantella aurantiaca]